MCRWACLEDASINRFLTHCLGCSGGGGRRIKHRRGFATKAIQACFRHHGTTTRSCLSIARKPVRQVTHSPNCLHLAVADPGRAGTGEPPCRSEAEVLSEAEANPLIKNPSRACLWRPRGKKAAIWYRICGQISLLRPGLLRRGIPIAIEKGEATPQTDGPQRAKANAARAGKTQACLHLRRLKAPLNINRH